MTVRPAYVLTSTPIGPDKSLVWTLMITNAARPGWHDDILIDDWHALGLIIPSKIRPAKVATNEISAAVKLGSATPTLMAQVRETVRRYLDWPV